jgi:HAD superfamily hydrolase (TIGR01490 family)
MDLVLFDLDNTLLSGDSDFEWAQFLIGKGVLDAELHEARNLEFYQQYRAGTLDIHAFLDFQLMPLSRHARRELDAWHGEFMAERIRPLIGAQARALVDQHLCSGALTAIVTATNSFVTAPIAREFGVTHLIATEPELSGGRYTGRVAGTPCFREGKLRRLDEWLAALGHRFADFEESTCYSDSHNDLPVLERVRHPVAVDPDPQLAAEARRRGWPVISLRAGRISARK